MAHNLSLPRHRYIWVVSTFVVKTFSPAHLIPAVWYGVSVTPGRMLGCHVVLENGAMVVDLPLHALRHTEDGTLEALEPKDVATWDMYGFNAEVFAPPYLTDNYVEVLDRTHKKTGLFGYPWFAIDHLTDGYALEPGQHKHLWVIALEDDGVFDHVPQDQLLIHDTSFTEVDAIPQIKRQTAVWRAE
jgi:hypothetical protein